MNPTDFARAYLGEHKIKGDEIVPRYCPFCHGGQRHDKETFALNIEKGTYNCMRGSCGVTGTFNQLLKHFGEIKEYIPRRPVTYKKPQKRLEMPGKKVVEYLKRRGISPETWQRRGVGEHSGAIAMPYFENGELVLTKFRPAHKPGPSEKKGWREEGGKPVFWGMDQCNPDGPLVIVEGEMDALALDEAGIPNVVSVPSGAEDLTCVDNCWEWLDKFKRVIIWSDNDEPGQKLERNLIQRLGAWRCNLVRNERKDANEVLLLDGKQAVIDAVKAAVPVPIEGLIRLADVPTLDYSKIKRVRSGIRGIDKVVGGFMMGELSVWTGINSSGKSTLLGQTLIEAIDQEFPVCAYSGELPARVFRYWIDIQAAGPAHIEQRFDEIKEKNVPYVKDRFVRQIREWYRNRFFLYDSFGAAKDRKIIEVFEYAAQRHGCKVFMVDNLMTTVFSDTDRDFYRQQSNFIGLMKDFAHRYDAHVHVVAHPRKTSGRLTKMDVSGSGDITNRADNVFSVHRCSKEEQAECDCKAFVDIFKNRFSGQQDVSIALNFDELTKRFSMSSDTKIKNYGWFMPVIEDVEALFSERQ